MAAVFTTTGARVNPSDKPYPSLKTAEADAAVRNKRAEALGIVTRYEARA